MFVLRNDPPATARAAPEEVYHVETDALRACASCGGHECAPRCWNQRSLQSRLTAGIGSTVLQILGMIPDASVARLPPLSTRNSIPATEAIGSIGENPRFVTGNALDVRHFFVLSRELRVASHFLIRGPSGQQGGRGRWIGSIAEGENPVQAGLFAAPKGALRRRSFVAHRCLKPQPLRELVFQCQLRR